MSLQIFNKKKPEIKSQENNLKIKLLLQEKTMQYQEFTQDYPKVISFDLNQNVSDSNSQISLINDKVSKTQDSESTMPTLMVGLLFILALAYVIGLVFVMTNLIVKLVIKVYQDGQVSSELYEQSKDLMRLDFEEHSCLV